jgi:hypothetical protein
LSTMWATSVAPSRSVRNLLIAGSVSVTESPWMG